MAARLRGGPTRRELAPEGRLYERALTIVDTDTTDSLSFLEGRAVPYGQMVDTGWWYLEQMEPDVFLDSYTAHPDLPLLLFHNGRSFPVGVADEWREESNGLHGIWRLDRDSPDAQRAARQARDGFLTGMSVGFAPVKSRWEYAAWDDWDPEDPATYDKCWRETARLLEVSLTPTPAYADAQVALVRSREGRRAGPGRPGGPRTRQLVTHVDNTGRDTPATPWLDMYRERLRTIATVPTRR